MVESGHEQPDRGASRPENPVTRYLNACRALSPGSLDRKTIGELVKLERAARRVMGDGQRGLSRKDK